MLYPSLAKNIIYGDLNQVKLSITHQNESTHELDEYGYTPLIEAVIFNKIEIVNFLIEQGVDVNSTSITGHSALHWAVENNNLEIAKILLQHGANPNAYSRASQPLLILPLLRQQQDLKNLLFQYGADLHFAQDYIATKLLAHRYELVGHVDIADSQGKYIELDLEGFFLEFTINVIQHSLTRFKHHFSAKHLTRYFGYFQQIIDAFSVANELIKYQHFSIKTEKYEHRINQLLNNPLQVIPLGYEGHAICFIRYKDILVKCDRGAESKKQGSVIIYRMQKPQNFNHAYIKQLIYTKQNKKSIIDVLPQQLDLVPITQLPIPAQITGNCSWANLEAAVPTLLFLLLIEQFSSTSPDKILACKEQALSIYHTWYLWDQQTALHEYLTETQKAKGQRKICRIMLLANYVFQKLDYTHMEDVHIAEKLLPVLMQPDTQYVLASYKTIFFDKYKTEQGSNLVNLLELCGYSFKYHE